MTKIAYLDCVTGIAGDMCLGALVDSGVPLEYLIEQLKGLKIDHEYELSQEKVQRNGQQATKVHVNLLKDDDHDHDHHHHHHHTPARHLPEIESMIQQANLPSRVTEWSLDIFRRLAVAEGAVHGVKAEKVHFHEVGATDAIVDIVGTCLGLDYLDIQTLYCSALPTGGGTVWAAHGRLPVPVPAVLKLWESRQVPIYSNKIDKELVTPTGAAIAVTLVKSFGQPPNMVLEKVGLGAGSQDLSIPNILRLWIGESVTEKKNSNVDIVAVLETQIDDLSPQVFGYVLDILLKQGALDVFTQSVMMKKSRPGILLTVICPVDKIDICEEIIFRETTTLGIRQSIEKRSILEREIKIVNTKYGEVRVKIATKGKGDNKTIINVHPEYEDCSAIALKFNQPLTTIQKIALESFYSIS